jgi:hypothetical protein
VALRAGITLAVPLAVLAAVNRTDLILYPTFGAFAAVYGRGPSVRARLAVRSEAALWLCACVTAGAAVGTFHREWLAIIVTALVALAGSVLAGQRGWQPPGPVLGVFAVAVPASVPVDASRIGVAFALSAVTALLAVSLDGVWLVLRAFGVAADVDGDERDRVPARLAAVGGLRTAAAVVAAGGLSTGLHWGHPYWAMIAAAAATSGPTVSDRVVRGVHRVIGTLVGLAVTDAVLEIRPGIATTVAIAVLCQMAAQLLVRRNYALSLVFITPMAILMVELGRRQPLHALLRDRALETVLGAACGIVVTLLVTLLARADRLAPAQT